MRDASAISDFVRTYLIREAASALRSERRLAGGECELAGGEVVGARGGRGVIDVDVDAVGAVGKAGDGEAAGAVALAVGGEEHAGGDGGAAVQLVVGLETGTGLVALPEVDLDEDAGPVGGHRGVAVLAVDRLPGLVAGKDLELLRN